MFNFSKKSVRDVYQRVLSDEELPVELECYRDILKLICSGVNYSPVLKDIIFALALVTKNDALIEIYLDKLKSDEGFESYEKKVSYYKNIYETRIDFFDINHPYLYLLIERLKNDYIGGNKSIFLVDDVLYGLSLDIKKIKNIDNKHLSELINFSTISLLIDCIIVHDSKRDEFENIDCLVNMTGLNESLAFEMCNIYDELTNLREILNKYISSLGRCITPLSVTLIFIRELIIYHLVSDSRLNINELIREINNYYIETGGKVSPIVLGFDSTADVQAKWGYFDSIIAKEISNKKDNLLLP